MPLKRLIPYVLPLSLAALPFPHEAKEEIAAINPPVAKEFTPPERVKKSSLDQLIIPELKGIVLLPSVQCLLKGEELKNAQGIAIGEIDLPGKKAELTEKLIPFLGEPLTLQKLYQIKNAIIEFYQDHFHPLVLIDVPTQNISPQVIQLVLTESRLGEVKVEGNERWSNPEKIKKLIEIKPNEYLNDRLLTRDLNFLNQSPYRQVDAIYEPGEKEGTTNLLLLVQDTKPYQFYVGTDNTGLQNTHPNLVYGGFTHGNMFGQGHTLSFQYTTSNFHAMQAYTAQYLAPLPNLHTINLYGGYASVFPVTPLPGVKNNSGYALQSSLRYAIPLLPTLTWRHDLTFGFDYKRTNTNQVYTSDFLLPVFNQSVNLTQFMIGYNGVYKSTNFVLICLGELYFSPMQWIAQQSDFGFSQLRPGAVNRWIYGKGAFLYFQKLPYNCYLNLTFRCQASSSPLLPSEQYGLGGFETVRGYHERVLNYDNALLASAEFHTPTWKLIDRIRGKQTLSDGLQLLFFTDFGWGNNQFPLPGEPNRDFLASIGPGARYFIESNFNCRFDYGIKLNKSEVIGRSFGYLHFSATTTY